MTIEPPPIPTHCPDCGAEYIYHQHPFKPLGAIWAITCRCEIVEESSGGRTILRRVPPVKR